MKRLSVRLASAAAALAVGATGVYQTVKPPAEQTLSVPTASIPAEQAGQPQPIPYAAMNQDAAPVGEADRLSAAGPGAVEQTAGTQTVSAASAYAPPSPAEQGLLASSEVSASSDATASSLHAPAGRHALTSASVADESSPAANNSVYGLVPAGTLPDDDAASPAATPLASPPPFSYAPPSPPNAPSSAEPTAWQDTPPSPGAAAANESGFPTALVAGSVPAGLAPLAETAAAAQEAVTSAVQQGSELVVRTVDEAATGLTAAAGAALDSVVTQGTTALNPPPDGSPSDSQTTASRPANGFAAAAAATLGAVGQQLLDTATGSNQRAAASVPAIPSPPAASSVPADGSLPTASLSPAGVTAASSPLPSAGFTPPSAPATDGGAAALPAPSPQPLTNGQPFRPADFAVNTTPGTADPAPTAPADQPVAGTGISGRGLPGEASWEGMQAPSVVLQKRAPEEVQVGRPARFEIAVRNAGQVPAHEVIVADDVPQGTELMRTAPEATVDPAGTLTWKLGTLAPGEERLLALDLIPRSEGEIGSVARLSFQSHASVRTVCTRPQLVVEHSGPRQVLIGEEIVLAITISNPGTGAATGVILEEDVPTGLTHAAGQELEYPVGTLRPGETRHLDLTLKATQAGLIRNLLLVHGDGDLAHSHQLDIEVVAPQLQVAVKGPRRRYLSREATYDLLVSNPGTAAARNLQLVSYLPKGVKFISTDNKGQYDAAEHAVFWRLEELPAASSGATRLTVLPIEAGEQKFLVEGRGDMDLTASSDYTVVVDALAELMFTIADAADPIEVGSDTTYEIRLVNAGSKDDTNIQLAAALPPELQAVDAGGPARAAIEPQRVIFDPLPRLGPREEAVFQVQVRGVKPGDHLLRVQVVSDEMPRGVSKEETTRVYADE